jgi:hypothetical protein
VKENRDQAVCYQPCQGADDCETGCCTDLKDTGDMVCAPAAACENPCLTEGETCTDSSQCCRGSCHQRPEIPEWDGCRAYCYEASECESGCCVPFSNSDRGYCADAAWCQCGVEGSECGPTKPACCENYTCAGDADVDTVFFCHQNCTVHSECASGCCAPLTGETHGACMDASWCGF